MIEKLFELIAPDECLGCGLEGGCLCMACEKTLMTPKKPSCVMCNALNNDNTVCDKCRARTNLSGASIAYRYHGVVKDLIAMMKFENKRSIARYFGSKLPIIKPDSEYIVSFVPCDGPSRRARGYDQAELLAKSYARSTNSDFRPLLVRIKHKKQVGQKRSDRFTNVAGNFQLKAGRLDGQHVMLVDDVVTTGATIGECTKVLREAGAKSVWALAVAKK